MAVEKAVWMPSAASSFGLHMAPADLAGGIVGGALLAVASTVLLGAIGQLSGISGILEAAAFGSDSGWQIRSVHSGNTKLASDVEMCRHLLGGLGYRSCTRDSAQKNIHVHADPLSFAATYWACGWLVHWQAIT